VGGTAANKALVRTTRSRIIYLRNDHKALMTVIEKHLHEHFARLAEEGQQDEPMTNGGPSSTDITSPSPQAPQASGRPFAKVNSVVAGSPAESAGLKAGDEIRNFGYVNHTNHDGLKRVAECVQGNEGVSRLLSRELKY
jgi:26S proteasome non-ATPase regulatory subunit 9